MRLRASDYPILSHVANEPTLRVMVFCASEDQGRQDIAFPHQSEIKVNGGEVKANLRGLKNKPGSTRPVDITKELWLKTPAYHNTVQMTYALTTKVTPTAHIIFDAALPLSHCCWFYVSYSDTDCE
jgi:E3 SUMO-protein ligase PIAS1